MNALPPISAGSTLHIYERPAPSSRLPSLDLEGDPFSDTASQQIPANPKKTLEITRTGQGDAAATQAIGLMCGSLSGRRRVLILSNCLSVLVHWRKGS